MIALTDTATTKVKELLDAEGQPELFLRVAVRPGGCSGMSYDMFFDSEKADDDASGFDPPIAHHLHDGAAGAVQNRR